MLALTFGSPAEATRAAQVINAVHDRLHGHLAAAAGPFPAGHGYCAHDPVLLRWVYHTLHHTLLRTYRYYLGPLSAAEQDRYCREARALGPPLGLPATTLPRDAAELREAVQATLTDGSIVVTPVARRLARQLLFPPMPAPLQPLPGLMCLPAIGLLPRPSGRGTGFPGRRSRRPPGVGRRGRAGSCCRCCPRRCAPGR